MVSAKSIALAVSLCCVVGVSHAVQNTPEKSTPEDRGYGVHDACFGDKYESDDDLKTGNEQAIEDILKLLDSPGS